MNCHGHNNQGQDKHGKGHKGHGGHMLLMLLCCAIPIILLFLLPILNINSPLLKSVLPFAALLLCPLMHILMIPMMLRMGKDGNGHGHNSNKDQGDHHLSVRQIEDGKGEI